MKGLKSRLLQQLLANSQRETMNESLERRIGFAPVPNGIEYLLTEAQAICLKEADSRLSIAFVRSHDRSEPMVVVKDSADDSYGVLSDEGVVYYDSDLRLRA